MKRIIIVCIYVLLASPVITASDSLTELVHAITNVQAPMAVGELVDKITILQIKSKKIIDQEKLKNVLYELKLLMHIFKKSVPQTQELNDLMQQLFETNNKMWDLEDAIRAKEAKKRFDNEFIIISRNIYRANDHRVALKNKISHLTGCRIIEEKQYPEYS